MHPNKNQQQRKKRSRSFFFAARTMREQGMATSFETGFSWNLVGSLVFESLKFGHNFLLMAFMPSSLYGLMGTTFALVYFAARIAEAGATNAINAFFYLMRRSKHHFNVVFLFYSLFPLIPMSFLVGFVLVVLKESSISLVKNTFFFTVLILLIIAESVRMIFRQLLHSSFHNKITIITELSFFLLYLATVWGLYGFSYVAMSPELIFYPYLIDSFVVLTFFFYFVFMWHKKLSSSSYECVKSDLSSLKARIVKARLYGFFLKISKNIFTANFITPLFAAKFGFVQAGMFYFASALAVATQAVVKATIGYAGGALLANLKEYSTLAKKQLAFQQLSRKLATIIGVLLLVLCNSYSLTLPFSAKGNHSVEVATFSLFYLLLSFVNSFSFLYEQFYIVEESTNKLFLLKAFEISFLFSLLFFFQTTPLATLFVILLVRVANCIIVALDAFVQWKLKPSLVFSRCYVVVLTISIFVSLFIKLVLC